MKNMYLIFVPLPITELLKHLEFPVLRPIIASFVMVIR